MNAPANPALDLVREKLMDAYLFGGHKKRFDCDEAARALLAALAQTNDAGRGDAPAGWKWELVRLPPLCAKCGRESTVHDDNDPDRECEKYTPTVADGLLRAVQAARGGLAPMMPGTMPRPLDAPPSGAAVREDELARQAIGWMYAWACTASNPRTVELPKVADECLRALSTQRGEQ